MGIIKTKLKRLKNPDPKFISLVARGANHIPFRITKSDEETAMINLSTLSTIFKSAATEETKTETPATEAAPESNEGLVETSMERIVVLKGDSFDETKALIQKAGLSVETSTEEDGAVVFQQTGESLGGEQIVKSGDMLLVVGGMDNFAEKFQPFNTRVGVSGFNLGLGEAVQALGAALESVVRKSASPEATAIAVGDVVADFGTYVTGLMEALPDAAFAPEIMLRHTAPESVQKGDGKCAKCGESMVHKCGSVKKADETVQPVATTPTEKLPEAAQQGEVAKVEAQPEVVAKADEPKENTAEVVAKLVNEQFSKVMEAVSAVQKSSEAAIATLTKRTEAFEASLSETVKKADETAKKISSTVVAAPVLGDVPANEKVTKSENRLGTGYFDTAMDRLKKHR